MSLPILDEHEQPAKKESTRAGNYFVANYPPFSCWSPDVVPAIHEALDRPPVPGTPLGLYVHIPFCRKRCHFCYFRVYTDKDSNEISTYLDRVTQEAAFYAEKAFIGGRKLEFIYFGGGTPSYISSKELITLADSLKDHLPWDEAQEIAFECEPGTLTESKLQVIKDIGITRLSLGVENFDDHILEINGRAHRSKEVQRSYDFAQGLGFDQINIDLIAGMVGETDDNWQDCIKKTIELSPDSITVYQMEIPYNTGIYQEMKEKHQLTAPVADWPTKRRWVDEAFAEFEKVGYTVSSAYTVVKDPEKTHFIYRDRLWQGADMIALGVASFSHIGGTHFQNEKDMDPWLQRIQNGDFPIHRALTPTDDERLIREFILQLKLGRLNRDYFLQKYSIDIIDRFAKPLDHWQNAGFLTWDDNHISLTRQGLLRADSLLPEFFLPKHQNARYV
ncbi:MAG: coproporphyrinogen III oxidase family protein [Planctomycetes bacterium]|nr:coproporphyrinogen III oxidase family protein [Planctomycetota bacterium]